MRTLSLLLAFLTAFSAYGEGLVLIGHPGLPTLDARTVQRIYTGKMVELDGQPLAPANQPPGPLRNRFLNEILGQDEIEYSAYWKVRRYVGKGVPPRELSSAEIVRHVAATPGALGYVEESDVRPGVTVLLKR